MAWEDTPVGVRLKLALNQHGPQGMTKTAGTGERTGGAKAGTVPGAEDASPTKQH